MIALFEDGLLEGVVFPVDVFVSSVVAWVMLAAP